jgi:hypothetical protein
MNAVVEPMLDILQRTLGKRGGTHNHHAAFCGVFFDALEMHIRRPHPLSGGEFREVRTSDVACTKCEMPRIPNQGWRFSASTR